MSTRAENYASSLGRLQVPVSDRDHAEGPSNAPVTLVEYGDFQCPYCGQAFPVVRELQRRLGAQLRFVFRNFPLTEIHPEALHAAEAAESVAASAGEKAYWAMHDTIFLHQRDSATALSDESLIQYAIAAGADGERTADDLANDAMVDRVRDDFQSGVRSGVNGTPTFFVNGTRFDGVWNHIDQFAAALGEALLAANQSESVGAGR
jgi:protein-disulfide isomerase